MNKPQLCDAQALKVHLLQSIYNGEYNKEQSEYKTITYRYEACRYKVIVTMQQQ